MIDTHHKEVEIKVTVDPRGAHRIWVHVGGVLAVRVYVADLAIDVESAVLLTELSRAPERPQE